MSLVPAIRGVLIARPFLVSNLAKTKWNEPAVYRRWVQDIPRPYIALTYATFSADPPYMTTGPLNADIFADGPSSILAEQIRDDVISALDLTAVEDEGHFYRITKTADEEIPDDNPDVIHWNVQFEIRWWRQAFVEEVVARE